MLKGLWKGIAGRALGPGAMEQDPREVFRMYAPPNLLDVFTPEEQEAYGSQIRERQRKINADLRPSYESVQQQIMKAAALQQQTKLQQQQQAQLGQIFGGAPQQGGAPMGGAPMGGGLEPVIAAAAERHGVDPRALSVIASLESGGNPNAQNPNSSAGGPFQFIDSTAQEYGLQDRFDPAQATDAAARLMRDNTAALRQGLGREPNTGELYLAHQQGATGALRLLQNPQARAADLVGEDAVRLNGGDPNMPAGQFAGMWTQRAGAAQQGGMQQQPQQGDAPAGYDRAASANRYFQAAKMFAARGDGDTAKKYLDMGMTLHPNPSEAVRDLEYFGFQMQGQGDDAFGRLAQLYESKSSKVNVNTASDLGPIPPGHRLRRNDDGSFELEVLPNSPAAREIEKAERAADVARANVQRAGGVVVQNVGRALEMLDTGGRMTAGRMAVLGQLDPQSSASTLNNLIKDIQGNVGVDQLQQMREASPTGGALGNVTGPQMEMLMGLLGRLDTTGDRQVLRDNLMRIANTYLDLVHGTPEQIQMQADELGLGEEDLAKLTFRYPLSFDAMGRPVQQGGFTIERVR
jgi:hypothetical protein